MNQEIIRVPDKEPTGREAAKFSKSLKKLMAAARRVQSFKLINQLPFDKIFYDEQGSPN